jgi:hypothetical protein
VLGDEAEDGAASGGTTPSSTGIAQRGATDSETGLEPFMRNSAGLSGKASRSTTRQHTTLWPLGS